MIVSAPTKYWCLGCDLTFTTADTANAHHDGTGHHQSFRPRDPYRPFSASERQELVERAEIALANLDAFGLGAKSDATRILRYENTIANLLVENKRLDDMLTDLKANTSGGPMA